LVALIQAGFYLLSSGISTPAVWVIGLAGLASGAGLVIGFLTPVAGAIAGLGAVGIGWSFLPACSPNLFDAKLSVIFAVIMTAAIVFLGPGAYSVDARLFGRREIIIPPRP
jgi:uncharacterized membrane protein YphA (DoxX/SURF4 family)